jgi:hypothetical protein
MDPVQTKMWNWLAETATDHAQTKKWNWLAEAATDHAQTYNLTKFGLNYGV